MTDDGRTFDEWNWLGASYERDLQNASSAPKKWRLVEGGGGVEGGRRRRIRSGLGPTAATAATGGRPRGRVSHSVTPTGEWSLLLFGGGYVPAEDDASEEEEEDGDVVGRDEGDESGGGGRRRVGGGEFRHLDDLWTLDAPSATWRRVDAILADPPPPARDVEVGKASSTGGNDAELSATSPRGKPSSLPDAEVEETAESYWGMKFSPPRRGHAAAYYRPPRPSDADAVRGDDGRLIVFGGITDEVSPQGEQPSPPSRLLDDLWVFDSPSRRWRRVEPGGSRPSARRNAISWIDGDHYYLFGGEIPVVQRGAVGDDWPPPQDEVLRHPGVAMVIYRLGPLSSPIREWTWSIRPSCNARILLCKAPTVPDQMDAVSPREFGAVSFGCAAIVERHLWIFGGLDWVWLREHRSHPASNLFYRLNLDFFDWSVLHVPSNAPCPRYCHSMASLGKYLIVAGGIGVLGPENVDEGALAANGRTDGGNGGGTAGAHAEGQGNDTNTRNRGGGAAAAERTLFDLFLFNTEAMEWKRLSHSDVAGPWPSARNGLTMTRLGKTKVILFGGGVHPSSYFGDTYALEFDLSVKVPERSGQAKENVCADLVELYDTGLLSDATLRVGEELGRRKDFAVHRAILAARSRFFRVMFSGPFAESSSEEAIRLPDVGLEATDVVLRFLYSGSVDARSLVSAFDAAVAAADDDEDDGPRAVVSSVLRLSDLWGATELFGLVEDELLSASAREGCAFATDPVRLVAFARAHNCRRLAMRGLECARGRWDALRRGDGGSAAPGGGCDAFDAEVVEEIEDFANSLV